MRYKTDISNIRVAARGRTDDQAVFRIPPIRPIPSLKTRTPNQLGVPFRILAGDVALKTLLQPEALAVRLVNRKRWSPHFGFHCPSHLHNAPRSEQRPPRAPMSAKRAEYPKLVSTGDSDPHRFFAGPELRCRRRAFSGALPRIG